MDKQQIAQNVANKLWAAEKAIDAAMVNAAQLIEAMVTARQELNLAGSVGEVAQSRTAETIAALSEARRSIMATHAALANMEKKLDVTIAGGQDKGGVPNDTQAEADRDTHLRVAS